MNVARVSASRIRYTSDVKIVCDGNSLTEGVGGSPYPTQLALLDPINSQCTIANVAVGGQTTGGMNTNATDVDGAWVSGKTNILITWEGTNSIYSGATADAAITAMQTYITNRKAAHPWIVVVLTCLPRQANSESLSGPLNASIDSYNTALRSNFRAIGASAIVDVRAPGSPFNISGYTDAEFAALVASSGLWASESPHVHLNAAGYLVVANMVAATLQRLRGR